MGGCRNDTQNCCEFRMIPSLFHSCAILTSLRLQVRVIEYSNLCIHSYTNEAQISSPPDVSLVGHKMLAAIGQYARVSLANRCVNFCQVK